MKVIYQAVAQYVLANMHLTNYTHTV